jgi:hypothetical protein
MTYLDEILVNYEVVSPKGIKEEDDKLSYELDFEFLTQMAHRMSQNKCKYPSMNWKQPIDINKLKQSLFRHVVEIMKGNYTDSNEEFGHLTAVALNAMFINYQLKTIEHEKNQR